MIWVTIFVVLSFIAGFILGWSAAKARMQQKRSRAVPRGTKPKRETKPKKRALPEPGKPLPIGDE